MRQPLFASGASLLIRNQQRACRLDVRLLRRIARTLLRDLLVQERFQVAIYFVSQAEMSKLNERYLHHQGSTDVICFDYSEPNQPKGLVGDVVVCVNEAIAQAPRFRTSWQEELVRYLVHGVLHLCGYDDRTPGVRREMKRLEDRCLRSLAEVYNLRKVGPSRTHDSC